MVINEPIKSTIWRPAHFTTTNMRIPRLREGLINRSSLLDKMDQALNFPLTLITAPAGFGKTTLLSQWNSSSRNEDLQNRVAWVSLESDCDLRQFWTYILVALEEIQSGVGESALALLEPSQPPIQTILRILINGISAIADYFVLALDDYHHIDDPTIHTALTYFVNHLPSNLHLVVASRSHPPLPLARWRASNQLFELREPDLVFELHRRAAEWYIRAGRTNDAIRHACTAREWEQAIELIEMVISTAWNRGEIRKIIEWVGSLPREYQDSHPHLSLYYSRALLHGGQLEAAEQRLREAEALLRASMANPSSEEDKLLQGMVCAFRTTVAAVSNEPANALDLGCEALSLLSSEKMDIRAYVKNWGSIIALRQR